MRRLDLCSFIISYTKISPDFTWHVSNCETFFSINRLVACIKLELALVSPSAFSRRAVVSYWRKYVHEVLVNRLGGLSLPRKSVVRLTDRPDMTLDVYRGRKTTKQQKK